MNPYKTSTQRILHIMNLVHPQVSDIWAAIAISAATSPSAGILVPSGTPSQNPFLVGSSGLIPKW
jgi:hypothetical protein